MRRFAQVRRITRTVNRKSAMLLSTLLDELAIETKPITYKNFPPFSAADIFHSNLHADVKDDDGAPLRKLHPTYFIVENSHTGGSTR